MSAKCDKYQKFLLILQSSIMRIVSFFAGCGGLDLGFEQAGCKVIWANEFNPECQETYVHGATFVVLP